jgi:hypothetical protein
MTVCRGRDHPERDTLPVDHHRAFETPLPAVHWAFSRLLAATRSLRDAAIYGYVGQIKTDGPIVGFARHIFQSVHQTGLDPLVASVAQGGSRTRLICDPPVGASKERCLKQLLEEHIIGYAGPMAAKRMISFPFGKAEPQTVPRWAR